MSFSLTRKTDYALVALSALARQREGGGDPVSARHIAETNGLPLQLLMNVLKELHRADVVGSRRGVSGGYFLDMDPEDITLRRVLEILEGPVSVSLCASDHLDHDVTSCQMEPICPISEPIRKFNDLLNDFLANITLRQLIENKTPVSFPMGVSV
ncbi:MAG: Rrf2 family transcriptional regulator [Acidobacteriota bacterium]|nr:Rrf2 family transcriptional regulator [Acidobacteriota bacterium]